MLTVVEKVLFLMRAPVTSEITTDGLSRLAAVAHEHEAPMNAQLFTAGDMPDALYIVLDGAVRVAGRDVPSRLAGPGDVVGGLCLFSGAPHLATATTLVQSRLLRIDREDLDELLDEDGELARALFTGLIRALRTTAPAALTG